MNFNGHDEFERFRYRVAANNTSGGITPVPLELDIPKTLATLSIHSDPNDVVWLTANIGWLVTTNATGLDHVDVLFKIWRGNPITREVIYSAIDSAQAFPEDHFAVTSLAHVDTDFNKGGKFHYTLTAEITNNEVGAAASVIGPITFTALEIGVNEG